MKNISRKLMFIILALFLASGFLMETDAHARAGGGRSMGSRGSRSYSVPGRTYSQPSPSRQQPGQPYRPPAPTPQPAGGGFLRSMAGGVLGGMLGGMLFRGMGFGGGGWGGAGGGGFGLIEILLIVGLGYLIFRIVKGKRQETTSYSEPYDQGGYAPREKVTELYPRVDDADAGLANIRQMDPSFDEMRFNDNVMDIFFKVQSAWMNRDLAPATGLMTDEMRRIFQEDMDGLLREKRTNRLENIAVRNVEVEEAWQEAGQDFITALIYANLLDYTTEDATGQVISGSKTEPVKFEEYWTFTRPVGNNPWKLSAINQK